VLPSVKRALNTGSADIDDSPAKLRDAIPTDNAVATAIDRIKT
jgi:hypothetical protein